MSASVAPEVCPGRVLIVEDMGPVRRALCRRLRSEHYEVYDAEDCESASALLDDVGFDAVATDINLPGRNGMTLLRQIHGTSPEIPVVLMTGLPELGTAIEAVQQGAFSYLTKPFKLTQFSDVIDRAVREHRRRCAAAGPDLEALDTGFTRALSKLHMVYQPIVGVGAVETRRVEALMRSSAEGFELPCALLHAAETLGRVHDMSRRVRGLVADLMGDSRGPEEVFVNLHPLDLADDALLAADAPLSRHAHAVVLELTERQSLSQIDGLGARIDSLRAMGYRIAIDDVGAGYSSLNYVAELAPDIVKIDQSLVRGIHLDDIKARLVGMLTNFCRGLDIDVVGEGVETEQESVCLVELGCNLLQGYLFGRPGPYVLE